MGMSDLVAMAALLAKGAAAMRTRPHLRSASCRRSARVSMPPAPPPPPSDGQVLVTNSPGRAFAAGLEIRYVKTLLSRCNLLSSHVIGDVNVNWSRRLTAIGGSSPPRSPDPDSERGAVTTTLRRSRPTPHCLVMVLAMPPTGTPRRWYHGNYGPTDISSSFVASIDPIRRVHMFSAKSIE